MASKISIQSLKILIKYLHMNKSEFSKFLFFAKDTKYKTLQNKQCQKILEKTRLSHFKQSFYKSLVVCESK